MINDLIDLVLGFFISNVLGYGGGPASIPLMYQEIVTHYHWTSDHQFSNILALGNTLPGPIATKIAAFVGYDVAGIPGALLALAATIVPSAIALIVLLRIMQRYRQSTVVKGMTLLVQLNRRSHARPDMADGQNLHRFPRHLASDNHCGNRVMGDGEAQNPSGVRHSVRVYLWRTCRSPYVK